MGKLYGGSSSVKKAFYGSTAVKKIYYGSTLIFSAYETYTLTFNSSISNKVTFSCSRTSSPKAGASIGALSSGAEIYTDDVLSYTITAKTGYTINSFGNATNSISSTITVSNNVTLTCTPIGVFHVTYSAATTNLTTTSCTRTYSPISSASTGVINSGAIIYEGDEIEFTVTSASGYYVSESSTKDSTSYSEEITVSSDVTREFHAVSKSNYNINTTSASFSTGGQYPWSVSVSVTDYVNDPNSPYYPTTSTANEFNHGSITCNTSSISVHGWTTSANTRVRGSLTYYVYAPAPVTITNPTISSVSQYGSGMKVRVYNSNSFAVTAEYLFYYEDSSGLDGNSSDSTTISANSYKDIYIYSQSEATIEYLEFSVRFAYNGQYSQYASYEG